MMVQDRKGDLYEMRAIPSGSGVRLGLFPQSASLSSTRESGWLELGLLRPGAPAELIEVRVNAPYRECGLGTTLVRIAIDLARRSGASRLHGHVAKIDVDNQPFLPAWYERLGFTVTPVRDEWVKAVFGMDLTRQADAADRSKL